MAVSTDSPNDPIFRMAESRKACKTCGTDRKTARKLGYFNEPEIPMRRTATPSVFEEGSVLYFGADMLEFLHDHARLRFEFDPSGIDCDNSASGYVAIPFSDGYSKHFTYRRIKNDAAYSAAYGFTFVMEDRAVDAFALFYSGKNGTVEGKSKVVVYSSFFAASRRIPGFGLSGLREFLRRNFEVAPDSLWRLDVCADFSAPLPVLHSALF